MAKREGLSRRADKKPCPWCGVTAGFPLASGAEFFISMPRTFLQVAGAVFTEPHRLIRAATSGPGISRVCAACREGVMICPGCDTPNRDVGAVVTCTNCGRDFTT